MFGVQRQAQVKKRQAEDVANYGAITLHTPNLFEGWRQWNDERAWYNPVRIASISIWNN